MPRREGEIFDPYAVYNYTLEIDNVNSGGFSECTGLQMETKVFEYKEGGNNRTTLRFPEHSSYGNITLKRGITLSNELIDWHLKLVDGTFSKDFRNKSNNFSIILRDENGRDKKRWDLIRAFPVKWIGPDLKAAGNELAIESLEIAHEGIRAR